MADEIERTLGRIEQKVDDVRRNQENTNKALFHPGGLETRIRTNEQKVAVIKDNIGDLKIETRKRAGWISAITAGVVSGVMIAWKYLWGE